MHGQQQHIPTNQDRGPQYFSVTTTVELMMSYALLQTTERPNFLKN
jgi:hypothetical protein